ncbi:MAG TPA: transposase, partial [Candidatus Udaeobacter sp.]|nr:transposase [Candidatus Udaeobacter sp.]
MHPPQFKKKSKAKISFTESDPALFEIDEANKRLRLPKLGWVKCRFSRHIEGKPNSVTVNWNGRHWMVSVQSKVEMADPQHPSDTIVAGDFGIVRRVTFSDGVVVPPIDVSWEEHRKKFYQRGLRNKRKFSQSWKKIVSKISKLDRRIANIRKDETHKFTSAYRYRAGGFRHQEHVGVSRRKHGETGKESQTEVRVERALLRQGWGELGRQLEYKQLWQGGLVEYQSEAFSSQDCPKCSYRSPRNRKTQDRFACTDCGFSVHADEVAAANQLAKFISSDKGVALLASGYRASVNSLQSGRSWDSTAK